MYKKVLVGLTAVILLGLLAAAGIIIYEKIAEKYKESEVKTELRDYYNVPQGEAMLIFDEKIYEKNAMLFDGEPYLDFATVTERYSTLFMWSPDENRMYYTTPSKEYMITPGAKDILVNEEKIIYDIPPVMMKEDTLYVSMSFLKECSNITYEMYDDPARILVTYSTDEFLCATVKEESSIRVSQDIKADYLEKLPAGSVVRIIEGGGIQQKGFIKVMSSDGVRGYFLQEKLDWGNRYNTQPVFNDFEEEKNKPLLSPEKIYLVWHLFYGMGHIDEMTEYIETNPELNVVAPTWFFMNGTNGEIVSYGDMDYVVAAHDRKVNVWAVLNQETLNGDYYTADQMHELFSKYDSRMRLARNLVEAVKKCGADGINIDIEGLKVETGIYFVQFLRELSIKCREYGIVLSVDNYIPEEYNAFFNIPEQSRFVDYIVIMGYDEHYAGSDAGSVASLSWFKHAVDISLKKCGPEQIIMGIPFYTRLWKEAPDGDTVKAYVIKTMNMKEQDDYIASSGLEGKWLEKEGQYYYEYEVEDGRFRLWAEDKKSLALKAMVIGEKDLGGTAAWMLGGDPEGTWMIVKAAVNGDVSILLGEDQGDVGIINDDEETGAVIGP